MGPIAKPEEGAYEMKLLVVHEIVWSLQLLNFFAPPCFGRNNNVGEFDSILSRQGRTSYEMRRGKYRKREKNPRAVALPFPTTNTRMSMIRPSI